MVQLTAELLGGLNQVLHSLASRIHVPSQSLVFTEWGGSNHIANVINVCTHLINALIRLDNSNVVPSLSFSSIDEIKGYVQQHGACLSNSSDALDYKLLRYLCSAIQASLLIHKNVFPPIPPAASVSSSSHPPIPPEDAAMDVDDNSNIRHAVTDLAASLHILHEPQTKTLDILDRSIETVVSLVESGGVRFDSDNSEIPRILDHLSNLNADQTNTGQGYVDRFYVDFELRRKMLLERLEVTCESFLGSTGGGEEKNDKLKAEIREYMMRLYRTPIRKYQLSDAFSAPLSLLTYHSSACSPPSRSTPSLVKKALIGGVPDRGGRVNETRAGVKSFGIRKQFGGPSASSGKGGRDTNHKGDSHNSHSNKPPNSHVGHKGNGSGGTADGGKGDTKPGGKYGRTVTVESDDNNNNNTSGDNNNNRDKKPYFKKQKR